MKTLETQKRQRLQGPDDAVVPKRPKVTESKSKRDMPSSFERPPGSKRQKLYGPSTKRKFSDEYESPHSQNVNNNTLKFNELLESDVHYYAYHAGCISYCRDFSLRTSSYVVSISNPYTSTLLVDILKNVANQYLDLYNIDFLLRVFCDITSHTCKRYKRTISDGSASNSDTPPMWENDLLIHLALSSRESFIRGQEEMEVEVTNAVNHNITVLGKTKPEDIVNAVRSLWHKCIGDDPTAYAYYH